MRYTTEQIEQAKQYSLTRLLRDYGFEPKRASAGKLFYASPLRTERTASFCVFLDTNRYKDFGSGAQGNPVQLVMELDKCTFTEAIAKLLEKSNSFSFISNPSSDKSIKKTGYIIEKVDALKNKHLIKKLEDRHLDIEIAKEFLCEIYYKAKINQKHNYFGVAMQTFRGYEVKNFMTEQYYCVGSKDISYFDFGHKDKITIFEGMFDFIAFMSYLKEEEKTLKTDVIVLHSVSLRHKVLKRVDTATKLYLCLDNDEAGELASSFFEDSYSCVRLNKIYHRHKDFNEFWSNLKVMVHGRPLEQGF